jgi:hypothetical protein
METTFIYELIDPVTGRTRYIGKSDNPFKRFKGHLADALQKRNYCARWINSVLERGLVPFMELVDEVPISEWQFWEREYIRLYRALFFDLTNTTDGGENPPVGVNRGKKHSAEWRAKISASLTGRKRPPFSLEWRKNMGKARIGNTNARRKKP